MAGWWWCPPSSDPPLLLLLPKNPAIHPHIDSRIIITANPVNCHSFPPPTTSQLEPPKSHPQDVHRFIQSPTIPPAIHPGELWLLLLAPRAPNGNLLPINSAFATISTTIYLQPRTFHPTNKCRPNKRILSITILTHPPTTSNHYCIAAASLQFPIQS